MARLQEKYDNELRDAVQQKLGLKNVMEVPHITKITLNMGVGEAVADKKVLDNAVGDMQKIAGQKAVKTLARKSVAGFKIRDGYPIGCKVTLRRERMYEFLDRLVSEQIIFPEINYDEIDAIRGLDITISTSARNADEGRALLEAFSFPFKK